MVKDPSPVEVSEALDRPNLLTCIAASSLAMCSEGDDSILVQERNCYFLGFFVGFSFLFCMTNIMVLFFTQIILSHSHISRQIEKEVAILK